MQKEIRIYLSVDERRNTLSKGHKYEIQVLDK